MCSTSISYQIQFLAVTPSFNKLMRFFIPISFNIKHTPISRMYHELHWLTHFHGSNLQFIIYVHDNLFVLSLIIHQARAALIILESKISGIYLRDTNYRWATYRCSESVRTWQKLYTQVYQICYIIKICNSLTF
jgi:hypothetical protein